MFGKRDNNAIIANGDHVVNGSKSDIAITTHGSDWYFVRPARLEENMYKFEAISLTIFVCRRSAP